MASFKGNYTDFQRLQIASLKKLIEEDPKNKEALLKEIKRIRSEKNVKSNLDK